MINEQKEQENNIETDLKLENVEINSNITDTNKIEKIRNESIETVAQVAKDSLEETILLEASGDQAKAEASVISTIKEMPLM